MQTGKKITKQEIKEIIERAKKGGEIDHSRMGGLQQDFHIATAKKESKLK